MKIYLHLLPIFLFSSCNIVDSLGNAGVISLFVFLLLAMIAMIIFVTKKKQNADKTAIKFSHDVKQMLDKISEPNDKIRALDKLIDRINNDENYKKDLSWKNAVLSKVFQHKATIYYQMGNLDGIIDVCTNVISVEPSHMMSYYNRGTIYSNKGQYEKAIKDLSDAISLDNQYVDSYNNRGFAYTQIKDFEKALVDFDYVIALEPGAIVYYNRGNVNKELHEYDKALIDYETALTIDTITESGITQELNSAIQFVRNKLKADKDD